MQPDDLYDVLAAIDAEAALKVAAAIVISALPEHCTTCLSIGSPHPADIWRIGDLVFNCELETTESISDKYVNHNIYQRWVTVKKHQIVVLRMGGAYVYCDIGGRKRYNRRTKFMSPSTNTERLRKFFDDDWYWISN